MAYKYHVAPEGAMNIWQTGGVEAVEFKSPIATFDHEDRYRKIAMEAIDMKKIAEIMYPVRESFLAQDFISEAPYIQKPLEQLYFPGKNRKVDYSTFWHDPKVLSSYNRCYVYSEESVEVTFELKTCGGVKLWLNGDVVLLYKSYERNVPNKKTFTVTLKKGENELLLYANDLAERDVFYYYELVNKSDVTLECTVPIKQSQEKIDYTTRVIESIYLEKDTYIGEEVILKYDEGLLESDMPILWGKEEVSAVLDKKKGSIVLGNAGDEEDPYFSKTKSDYFPIKTTVDGLEIQVMLYLATYNSRLQEEKAIESIDERKEKAVEIAVREANEGSICTALAMLKYEGACSTLCRNIIETHLKRIEDRLDCADFRLAVILLMVKDYSDVLPDDLLARIKEAALSFRYWCDEPGNDVMWFFSENHALLFHVAQYLTGDLYENEVFVGSGRNSQEQKKEGYRKIVRWFKEFFPRGYEEWNSLTYLPVDCIAFFTLFDAAPDEDIKAYARKALDITFEIIAYNMHHKVYASSYGRTYEHTLKGLELGELAMYAWIAWGQGTVNVTNHAVTLFAVSSYQPLQYKELRDLSDNKSVCVERIQGGHGAYTYIYKNKDFSLASTMKFHPFEEGLQQHFINLSFSEAELPVWFNHPGEKVFSGKNRPSYWGGWQTIPYVEQYKDVVIAGIKMRESDEVDFIHANIPLNSLDEYEQFDQWFIFRKGTAYGGFWFSNGSEITNSGANTDKELISYGRENGLIIKCGQAGQYKDYESFKQNLLKANITYVNPEVIKYEDSDYGLLETDFSGGLKVQGSVVERNATNEPLVTLNK